MRGAYEGDLEAPRATRAAGALTLGPRPAPPRPALGIEGPGECVSGAGREAGFLIRDRLLRHRLGWSLTGGEFPRLDGPDGEHRWLVDPIDGTPNVLNGTDDAISIALRCGH